MAPSLSLPQFDRATGAFTDATVLESVAVAAIQAASRMTAPYGHRGLSIGCKAASFSSERDIIIRLNEDASFRIPFADRYWSRLLNTNYSYEEEIEIFLRSVADMKYTFLDCGANYGYWSVLVTSQPYGRQNAIAVEASPRNAAWLSANAALNDNRFVGLNAAIGGQTGGFVRITGHKHEALGTVALDHREDGDIRVLSLDDLVRDVDPTSPIIAKLDIEGVEIAAIDGARRLVSGNTLFICEDHGSDKNHLLSRYLIDRTPMRAYAFDPAIGRFKPLRDAADMDRIKQFSWVGYNVFATASSLWEDRLLSAR
jgi:FkbM family methyltransferase